MLTVYHGATEVISSPICAFGRPRLDFGRGFYVTDIKEQAVRWAQTMADKRNAQPLLNIYSLDRDAFWQSVGTRYSHRMILNGSNLSWQTDVAKTLQQHTTMLRVA